MPGQFSLFHENHLRTQACTGRGQATDIYATAEFVSDEIHHVCHEIAVTCRRCIDLMKGCVGGDGSVPVECNGTRDTDDACILKSAALVTVTVAPPAPNVE